MTTFRPDAAPHAEPDADLVLQREHVAKIVQILSVATTAPDSDALSAAVGYARLELDRLVAALVASPITRSVPRHQRHVVHDVKG